MTRPSHHFGEADVLREQQAIELDRLLREWEDADERERDRITSGGWTDDGAAE